MIYRPQTTDRSTADPGRATTKSTSSFGPHCSAVLGRVLREVALGHYDQAADIASRYSNLDPMIANAKGVCLMRLGRFGEAAALYRSLASEPRGAMRGDCPAYLKRNYAAALLLTGQPQRCLEILDEAQDRSNTAERLRSAIERWEITLTFGQKLDWWVNRIAPLGASVPLDFPPGEFGPIEDASTAPGGASNIPATPVVLSERPC